MSEKLFEAKTLEEALQSAATEFGVQVDELAHELVEEKTDDFWGLGDTVVVVRVWTEAEEVPAQDTPIEEPQVEREAEPVDAPEPEAGPETDASPETPAEPVSEPDVAPFFAAPTDETPSEAAAPESVEPTAEIVTEPVPTPAAETQAEPPAAPAPLAETIEDTDDLTELTVALLHKIFGHMEFECTAQARIDGDTLQVAIAGADVEYLLDGRGRGLSALELILNHGFRHRTDRDRLKIRVDAGDFRSKRDDELRDIAYQVSHQAKETGTEQLTKPLNPYERRIIHLTLADDPAVDTRSQGTGFLKAVAVIPERRR